MKNKIINFFKVYLWNYLKTNVVGVSVSVVLFFLIFIIPQYIYENDAVLDNVRSLIAAIGIGYLLFKFIIFRKNNKDFKPAESKVIVDAAGSVLAAVIGLLFGLLLMLIVNPSDAFEGFIIILKGGFNDGFKSFGDMIFMAVPIILTGLSVAFAFRTGLFNIGATGQLTMGAFTAVYIGVEWGFLGEIHPLLHWGTALIMAGVVGGLYGAIPGLLKAYRNVNEVVSSIMLNYIAMYLNAMLIKKYIFLFARASAKNVLETAETPLMNLNFLFPLSREINGGIVVVIVVVIILHLILNKTTFGFELKAVGFNRSASRYSGMNAKRNIVYSMIISGAIAGLAGGMIFLVSGKNLRPENVLIAEGFTGIAISLLGLSSPFGVLIAGLFYGSLKQGGNFMQLLDYKPEIIDIIIAVIIYASALSLFLQKFVRRAMKKRERLAEEDSVELVEGSDE